MKRMIVLGLLALSLVFPVSLLAGDSTTANKEKCDATCMQMQEIAKSPFVVGIMSIGEQGLGFGTGLVINGNDFGADFSGKKWILTNNHVVGGYRVWVRADKGFWQEVLVKDIKQAPILDIALLPIPAELLNMSTAKLVDRAEVGEHVYALGYPLGMWSVTEGRLNADKARTWLFMLSQAPLNPGNSGGPLFNEKLEVTGINSAIGAGANLVGFTIPIEHVRRILPRFIKEKVVRHGDSGFVTWDASSVPPILFERIGLSYPPEKEHAFVMFIVKNSPAEHAGVQVGDAVIEFDGKPVNGSEQLEKAIFFDYAPDDEVEFTFLRAGKILKRKIRLTDYAQRKNE